MEREIKPPKTVYTKEEWRAKSQAMTGKKPKKEPKPKPFGAKPKKKKAKTPRTKYLKDKIRKCIYISPELAIRVSRLYGGGNLSKAINQVLEDRLTADKETNVALSRKVPIKKTE